MTKLRGAGMSKSRIAAFEQCPKKLWLSIHRPELAEYDDGTDARFATGHEVGAIACSLHLGGVMVEAIPDLSAALRTTKRLIDEGHDGPIFEATFEHDGVLVRVDVLERNGSGGWRVAEVKSSTGPKDYHRGDLATQVWVMREAGFNVRRAAVRHIDSSFVYTAEGDYAGLFADAEMLSDIEKIIAGRSKLVAAARRVLAGTEPSQELGDHCAKPFNCEFTGYCHRDVPAGPEWPITVLPNGAWKKWATRGVEDLLDLDETKLTAKQARIVQATRSGSPWHDHDRASSAICDWGWPRAWLDFETIAFAVPRWLGTSPYQQVPFQFSVHVEHMDGRIEHHEFLHCGSSDPREACTRALVQAIPEGATIIAYNASFEKSVLRQLAAACPGEAQVLLRFEQSTVDLLPVTRENWYHRDQRGSWSIKAVLPTMAELDYGSLAVGDGLQAQLAWLEATHPETAPDRRAALQDALKAYCEQDTWAMILVARRLCNVA